MNPAGYCVVLQGGKRDFCRFNRLAAALAKSQDHRVSCGVFAFGVSDNFVGLKRDLVARLHVGCITSSVATCLMSNDGSMTKQQGVLGVYLVRIQTIRQSYLTDRQGALADGLHGLNPRNTDNRTHPLHCRPALIERLVKDWVQRWNKAQSISESIRQAHLVLRLFFNLTWSINEAVKRWSGVESIHPWRTYA